MWRRWRRHPAAAAAAAAVDESKTLRKGPEIGGYSGFRAKADSHQSYLEVPDALSSVWCVRIDAGGGEGIT